MNESICDMTAMRENPTREMNEKKLLVVDDEAMVCRIVEGFLGVDGWLVDSVYSIENARQVISGSRYPVVLLDVHLPGSSTDFLRELKDHDPTTQVIMFTGDPTIGTAREAIQHGAYEYVPKPCQREEISWIVRRAFDRYKLLREQERLQAENESYRQRLEDLVQKRTVQLRESELRYQMLFNRAVDSILLVDISTGDVSDHNIAATRLLNLSHGNLTGRSIRDFVGDQLDSVLTEAAESGHREWRFPRVTIRVDGGGHRLAQISIGKVEFEDQCLLQIVARDITDQIELAQRSELMEIELLSEQRLAAIGLLASGIAHNINTPLMGIYGTAQLIKMKFPEMTDIDGVIQQVERINSIIRNLMWKSRQEQESKRQEINLNELLHEELRFLDADLDFKHNITKQFTFADDVPAIMGRYSDFSQSITNIIRNALDSMHGRDERVLQVITSVRDGDIRVTISDTGCGISPEDRERIFMPFYTTKPLIGKNGGSGPTGTGLGLSTVQKLLSPYNARFEVDSDLDKGTSFTICLPIAENIRGLSETPNDFDD